MTDLYLCRYEQHQLAHIQHTFAVYLHFICTYILVIGDPRIHSFISFIEAINEKAPSCQRNITPVKQLDTLDGDS